MARTSIRRRFLIGSIASALVALALFAVVSLVVIGFDDADQDLKEGDSFGSEVAELFLGGMAVAAPLAIAAAVVTGVVLSRRSARPLEDAIRAARETTTHDLRRTLPVPARDDELRDLVLALNGLFGRLDDGFGALERFAADASHELRTPLAIVATELEIALRHPRPVAEWEATGRASLEAMRRMSTLVEGLLTLARAGADAPAARAPVDLLDCIDAVVEQLADAAGRSGITLTGPDGDRSEPVEGNAVMLETAIRNLVENAIHAAPYGGQVRVLLESGARDVVVSVEDDGPGLGPDPDALFAPFRRGAEAQAGTSTAGVGLGLAIARRVAVAHGGRLDPGTSALGGARFALSLPRAVA